MESLAEGLGVTLDPSMGALMLLTHDCANSATADVTVRVEGRAPDGFFDEPLGNNPDHGFLVYFLNLDPGDHEVTVTRDDVTIATDSFYVESGALTSVLGLGPGR